MAFTFPVDSNNKAGAVVATNGGNNFVVPTTIYGSDGVTLISTTNRLPVDASVTQNALSAVVTMQNAAVAPGTGTPLGTSGMGVASLAISGTFVATIQFEGLAVDGNWYPIQAKKRDVFAVSSLTTTNGLFQLNCSGLSAVRADITSYTSGNVTVKGVAQPLTPSSDAVQVIGNNVKEINISSKICPAGSYTLLAQIYITEGIKSISGCFKSSDPSFPCSFYVQNVLKSGAVGTSSNQMAVTQNKADIQFTLSAESAQIYFYNADTTSHSIDVDILGWSN